MRTSFCLTRLILLLGSIFSLWACGDSPDLSAYLPPTAEEIQAKNAAEAAARQDSINAQIEEALEVARQDSLHGRTKFTDYRDGRVYRQVTIGTQTWMAENLNYGLCCMDACYENKGENCIKYGKLYTLRGAENICPSGWHLPSQSEFQVLIDYVGGESNAGFELKSRIGWNHSYGGNGSDRYGFSALPGGTRSPLGDYNDIGEKAVFWTPTARVEFEQFWSVSFKTSQGGAEDHGYSIRCIKDGSPEEGVDFDCSVYNCVTTDYLNQAMLAAGKYGALLDTRDAQVYRTIEIGTQTWMAQNLNYASARSQCLENSADSCRIYGRLYLQSEATSVCPSGWHLPSEKEWNVLNDYVDSINGTEAVGTSLKALNVWKGTPGTNLVGFSGLPGHYFGNVFDCGYSTPGLFWTADKNKYRSLLSDNEILDDCMDPGLYGMSVRCLKGDRP